MGISLFIEVEHKSMRKKEKEKGEKRKKEISLQLVATQVKTHQGPQSSNFAGNSSVEEAIVR